MEIGLHSLHDKFWAWFNEHAKGPYALPWLWFFAFIDAIFFPIAPELLLAALVAAHKTRWREYLAVSVLGTTMGAVAGYFIAITIFYSFGEPILAFYNLTGAFDYARNFIHGHVFVAMALASFTPIPDKVYIYAGGFLGVAFWPFITGYVLGRSIRMAIVVFLAERYGKPVLDLIAKYLRIAALIVAAVLVYYVVVHFDVFGMLMNALPL